MINPSGTAITSNIIANLENLFISSLPLICIRDITYDRNKIINIFDISAGCNENAPSPISNQLVAPFIGSVNNTAISETIDIAYRTGDIFTKIL